MGFIASASVLVAGIVWGGRLLISPGPFDDGPAALLAVSLVVACSAAALGLVLARGRWARRYAMLLLGAQYGLAVAMDLSPWGVAALTATSIGAALVAGPWLDSFLRRLPPAEPIPVPALVLAAGAPLVPGLLAVASPGGVVAVHWLAGIGALIVGWLFARAVPVGLWALRVVLPALLVAAGVATGFPGIIPLVAVSFACAVLAWLPSTARAVRPLVPTADGVAVPPQLVPPDLLARAGYDSAGRPVVRKR